MAYDWIRKLRGVAGLSAVGGAIGAVFGVFWKLGATMWGFGTLGLAGVAWSVVLWSGTGILAAGGVAALIATSRSVGSVREVSTWKVGACGALMGAGAPALVVLLMAGSVSFSATALAAGVTGVLGGLLGAGLVEAAKRADMMELDPGERPPAIGAGRVD